MLLSWLFAFPLGSTLAMIKLMEGAEQFPAQEVICFLSRDLAPVSSFHHLEEHWGPFIGKGFRGGGMAGSSLPCVITHFLDPRINPVLCFMPWESAPAGQSRGWGHTGAVLTPIPRTQRLCKHQPRSMLSTTRPIPWTWPNCAFPPLFSWNCSF